MEQTLLKPIWKGQITIPWSWRKALWITKETFVKATLTANWVLLQNAYMNFDDETLEDNFDESIKISFDKITSSWKLDNLSKILSEKY